MFIVERIPVNIYRFLLIIMIIFGILLYIKKRSKKPSYQKKSLFINSLEYFILPFYQFKTQKIKMLWLLIVLLVIPFSIVVLYNDCRFPEWTNYLLDGELNESVFWGGWFSVLSIIFTIRIYLEFIDKQKHSLGEFLMLVNSFFDKTNNGDKIKILMPTLYIGALTERNFFRNYKNKLLHICRNNKTTLSFLDYGKDLENGNISLGMDCEAFDTLDSNINNFPLFRFHNNWFPRNNPQKYARRKRYYEKMFLFLREIKGTKAKINLINREYFLNKEIGNEGGVGLGNEDLFMFINQTKGIIYIGHIKIISQTSLCFEASLIENVHLASYFSELYESFVSCRIKKNNYDTIYYFYSVIFFIFAPSIIWF